MDKYLAHEKLELITRIRKSPMNEEGAKRDKNHYQRRNDKKKEAYQSESLNSIPAVKISPKSVRRLGFIT